MTPSCTHRHHRRRGFTFVELMIAMVIFAVVASGALQLTLTGSGAYRQGISVTDLEGRTARTLERMVRELSRADAGSLNPPDPAGGSLITFIQPQGVAGTAVIWGPSMRYTLELMPGEIDNGLDDNGNGLIDERSLVQIEDPGGPNERRVVLANGVAELLEGEIANGGDDNGNLLADEPGLAITIQQGAGLSSLTVRLTLQGIGSSGELMQRTLATTVALRN